MAALSAAIFLSRPARPDNRCSRNRWEKFAQQKGITKRKRSVKVWDEEQQEWRRRFGYKRAGDLSDVPIVEADADAKVPTCHSICCETPRGRELLRMQIKSSPHFELCCNSALLGQQISSR